MALGNMLRRIVSGGVAEFYSKRELLFSSLLNVFSVQPFNCYGKEEEIFSSNVSMI